MTGESTRVTVRIPAALEVQIRAEMTTPTRPTGHNPRTWTDVIHAALRLWLIEQRREPVAPVGPPKKKPGRPRKQPVSG